MLALLAGAASARAQTDEPGLEKLTRPRFSYPTWSPDGTRILYESSVSGNWEIYTVDRAGLADDGGDVVRLTDSESLDRMPSWSPDGRYIAFISDRDGDFEVFRMRADGTEVTQLTHDEVHEIHPYWSPDGSRIIYDAQVEGQRLYDLHIMKPDGSDDTLVLGDGELNSYAQISPDGRRVVFDKWVDNDETNGEIFVLELDSGELTRLTENEGIYDGYPTWFPDGERVLFSSEVADDRFKLFSIRIDGTDRRQLTFGPGSDARADISPDGAEIVFNRDIDDNINIYVLAVPD